LGNVGGIGARERPDRVVDKIVDTLRGLGVKHVLGITGGSIMALFDALYFTDDIEVVMFRHEQGAVHAAEGYARVAKRPAVVAATSGPGATNLVTGIADAYMDSVPVVAITGQVPTWVFGRDGFQETDILGVVTPITKWVYQVKKPEEATAAVKLAYEISTIGRPGPTLVDIPRDLQLAKASGESRILVNIAKFKSPKPSESEIALATKIILEAERPVVLVGGGVLWSGATKEVLELAERLNAPIVSTLPGKAAIPHNHPLYMGPAGMHGRAEADAALANADVIIAVGTRFSDRTWGRFKELQEMVKSGDVKLIHIDVDKSEIGKNVKPTLGIVADAREALKEILRLLPKAAMRNGKFLEWLYTIRRRYEEAMERRASEFKFFAPWKVLKTVRRATPPNTITVTGVGGHQMWAEIWLDVYEPGTFITSAGLGTMGFGIPASLGAKLAERTRPVVCIDGDGSFQMTFNNLALVREYDLPFVEIIFNNTSLQLVKQWQIYLYGNRQVATRFARNPDFVKMAEAYNIEGIRPSSYEELEKAVSWAVRNNEPLIIDVTIDEDKDIVLPWVKPGDWLTQAILPNGMEDVVLTYEHN